MKTLFPYLKALLIAVMLTLFTVQNENNSQLDLGCQHVVVIYTLWKASSSQKYA